LSRYGTGASRGHFHDDDGRFFLHTLSQACENDGRVHAWVLMSNHEHFFL
jgi:hypothetical protein